MDFEKYEREIIADAKKELHRSFVIQKEGGLFIVRIDTVGDQPGYFDLKNAINILGTLSGRIAGIVYDDVKDAFATAYASKVSSDPFEGAKRRRDKYNKRFKG